MTANHPAKNAGRRRPRRAAVGLGCVTLLVLMSVTAWAGPAAELPASVRAALARSGVAESALSVSVEALDADAARPGTRSTSAPPPARTVLRWQATEPRNPASLMKLVTTFAALELLGPDFTWTNRVETTGRVHDGVLDGNLVLRGSGDPKLVVERLEALLAEVRAAGIVQVRGDIVLDGRIFEPVDPNPARFDDEPLRPYNARPEGLLINFKAVVYRFIPEPERGRARIEAQPPLAGVELPESVPLSTAPCGDWRARLRADFTDPDRVRFEGAYPLACGVREWPVAYPAPERYAPRVVEALWRAGGGTLTGRVRWIAPGEAPVTQPLLQARSLSLASIVADINKFSNNVMAQQLFLTLSAVEQGQGSFAASRERLRRWWQQRLGAVAEAPEIENGSGLSRHARLSAEALAAVLRAAVHSAVAEPFIDSLGVAGIDGTVARLRERRPDSPLLGRAWLKTGSLRDVAAVAGYVRSASDRLYAVVAIVNAPEAPAARPALDALLEWVAQDAPSPGRTQARALPQPEPATPDKPQATKSVTARNMPEENSNDRSF